MSFFQLISPLVVDSHLFINMRPLIDGMQYLSSPLGLDSSNLVYFPTILPSPILSLSSPLFPSKFSSQNKQRRLGASSPGLAPSDWLPARPGPFQPPPPPPLACHLPTAVTFQAKQTKWQGLNWLAQSNINNTQTLDRSTSERF